MTVQTKCEDCERYRGARDSVLVDLANAEIELRVLRRKVETLKSELSKRTSASQYAGDAQEVFDYWAAKCRGASTRVVFGDKRKKAVIARLNEGSTLEDLCEAIDGAVVDAYVGDNGVRHDDLELICRDECMVDKFRKRRRAWAARFENMSPKQIVQALEAVSGVHHYDHVLEAFQFRCPVCRAGWEDPLYRPLEVALHGGIRMICKACGAGLEDVRKALAES